jgi:hypothetical protein
VAQVVEAQSSEARRVEGIELAAAQCGAVEVAAEPAGEDDVVVGRPALALPELGEHAGDVAGEWNRAALPLSGAVSRPPAKELETRMCEAAKSTSRHRSAISSPRRSPVNAAVR